MTFDFAAWPYEATPEGLESFALESARGQFSGSTTYQEMIIIH